MIRLAIILLLVGNSLQAQNARADGYKGIWFTLGQFSEYGDKYSGGLGTYTSSHVPIAIYSKEADKTFFVYGGTTAASEKHLLIMIAYYDHKTNSVPRPVIVYDKVGVDDPHDNASLSIDRKGYIWVFVSGRNTSRPGIIFKSRMPLNIDTFEKIKEGEMTYPQPWPKQDGGFLYLFTKYTKGRELYWTTSNDGKIWQPVQKLAGMGGHYQVSARWKSKVVTMFNYHPGGNVDKRTNCYLLQTMDEGKTWTTTHNYDMGSLYIEGDHWRIIGPTEKGPQPYGTGGEMALWESSDAGKSWTKTKVLTANSLRNHSYARRPLNAHPDFYAFWADGDASAFSESHLYFCNKKGDKVMKLPYDMKNDFEKPILLPQGNQ